MDFWRPNYLDYAVVSSQYSVKKYMEVLELCFQDFQTKTNVSIDEIDYFCYHTPFSRMAERVHQRFLKNKREKNIPSMEFSLTYNRLIGNAYTASLYISLCSLLENSNVEEGQKIGLFSYGSGCVAEYFYGEVQTGFLNHLFKSEHSQMLKDIITIDIKNYLDFYQMHTPPRSGSLLLNHQLKTGTLKFLGFDRHSRIYQKN
jgi:hydroxymethylglutaryl-CoA synthase